MFEQQIELQNKSFQSNLKTLSRYCEKYPDIKTFVELIFTKDSTVEGYAAHQLKMFMYELGYTLNNTDSEFNFDLEWSSTLVQFIGNYFLDDASFNLKKENSVWKVYADFDCGIQDPIALVNAARDNAKHYWDCDNRLRELREKRINQLMEK